jgi:ribosomal subunit interface protein
MRPVTTLTTFHWSLVTKKLHGHEMLRKQIHEKIGKLEKHLKHFPPDTVYLQIALGRQPKKSLYTAALNLRVPSNILHSEKSSTDVIKAFDDAVDALLREVESLKARLRRERLWKRQQRREQLHRLKAGSFTAEVMPGGAGPQTREETDDHD